MSPLMSSDSLDLSNVQTEHKEGKTDIFLHVHVLPSSLDHLPGGTNPFLLVMKKAYYTYMINQSACCHEDNIKCCGYLHLQIMQCLGK